MERLTKKCILGGWTALVPKQEVVDRLSAYEDTGLEPEDMLSAVDMGKIACALHELVAYKHIGPVSELRALQEAEQKRREGCEFCHDDACISRCQMRGYRLCPHCGRDLRGESHDGD